MQFEFIETGMKLLLKQYKKTSLPDKLMGSSHIVKIKLSVVGVAPVDGKKRECSLLDDSDYLQFIVVHECSTTCVVLCCIASFCILFLYCIVLWCTILYCILFYCIVIYCIASYCILFILLLLLQQQQQLLLQDDTNDDNNTNKHIHIHTIGIYNGTNNDNNTNRRRHNRNIQQY